MVRYEQFGIREYLGGGFFFGGGGGGERQRGEGRDSGGGVQLVKPEGTQLTDEYTRTTK